MSQCLIAVGANLGDRSETIDRALQLLTGRPQVSALAHSGWRETAAVGGPADQPAYLNGAILLTTALSPTQVLAELQAIEQRLGRERGVRWGARTIDLDLLLYDDVILTTPELTLPHPRMAFRRFVIEPAAEVAPEMRHPQIGWTMRQLYEHLLHATPYVAIAGAAGVGKSRLREQLATCFQAREIEDFLETALRCSNDKSTVRALAMEVHRQRLGLPPTTDAPGPSPLRQIEWLRLREPLVRRANWIEPQRLAVSDFWIEQSLEYAAVAGLPDELAELQAAWLQIKDRLVPPKLLVMLDPPSHSREALQQAIAARCALPGIGPVLRLTSGDPQADFLEVSAALIAMQ